MNQAALAFADRQAQLRRMGPDWQKRLAYGDATVGWKGDRNLVIYSHPLTDEIVIQYELLDEKPVLVFKVPAEGFDMTKVLTMLRDADARVHSTEDVIERVDKKNELVFQSIAQAKAERKAAGEEKLKWAIAKDTGKSIAPMQVPRSI